MTTTLLDHLVKLLPTFFVLGAIAVVFAITFRLTGLLERIAGSKKNTNSPELGVYGPTDYMLQAIGLALGLVLFVAGDLLLPVELNQNTVISLLFMVLIAACISIFLIVKAKSSIVLRFLFSAILLIAVGLVMNAVLLLYSGDASSARDSLLGSLFFGGLSLGLTAATYSSRKRPSEKNLFRR